MASIQVDFLIGIIVNAVQNEASLLGGIHDELDQLRSEFESMKSFLEDVERDQTMSEGEKTWVSNVRDSSYQAEDIIDEYMYYMYKQQRQSHFTRFLHQIVCRPKQLRLKHRIASKLQQINKTIKAIPERRQRYAIDRAECSSKGHDNLPLYQRDSSVLMKEDDVVGIEYESRLLKIWLTDGEQQPTLISVIGMGGSGKTTLVATTYNNETVKSHFDCHAWITVSQTYSRNELLIRLVKEFHQSRKEPVPDLHTNDFKEITEILINYLKLKKYLLVLDDVWDTDLWEAIMPALRDNQLGSRIMLTTRKEDVGRFSSGARSHILLVQPLKMNEAWDLFCMKAFSSGPKKSCPTELEPLAWELVEKSQGLPLAIVALGGLMSCRNSIAEWISITKNLNWQLSNNKNLEVVKNILLLSFSDLPCPLKHCFLYCCLFPEDYRLKRKRLIRLWTAEGFVQQASRVTPEDVADSYLMELIRRNMLQVVSINEFGRPQTCQMHDLLRDLALSISEREKFCSVYDGRLVVEECKSRRLAIQAFNSDIQLYDCPSQVRSLLLFVTDSPCFPNKLLSKLKLLRVLDLEDAAIEKLPDGLGTLYNLRYLNLKGTRVAELPKCVGKLCNLETLNIRDTAITKLPKEVGELQNLRYLLTYRYNTGRAYDFYYVRYPLTYRYNLGRNNEFHYVRGTRAMFKINKLKKLQAMSFVEAEGDIIRQLGSLTQLIRMGISNLKEADEMDLCSSITNLKLLHYLFLMAADENEFLRLEGLHPPPHLQKLILAGKLERIPHWFSSLQYLTYLYLHWSRIEEDLLSNIATLPLLGRLELVHAFAGEELNFSRGFAKLRSLLLCNFQELKVITIEAGVMPDLQLLCISSCMELNSLPQGIEFLTNLQALLLVSNSSELSKDLSRVRNIPNMVIF